MASAWGSSWGSAWGNAWGLITSDDFGAAGNPGGIGWNYQSRPRKVGKDLEEDRILFGVIPEPLPDIGVIKPEIAKVVVESVKKVVAVRKIANPEIDLALAEQEMRAELKALKKRWLKEYINILAIEYARLEQENEDAQIAMLLFEM